MKTRSLVILAALISLTGCAHVPSNRIEYTSPTGEKFTIENPKQWGSSNLVLTLPGGASLKADQIISANDVNVVNSIVSQNITQGQQLLEALTIIKEMIAAMPK